MEVNNPVKSKLIFFIKNENRESKRFFQRADVNYEGTFLSVAKLTNIRIVLAVGTQIKYLLPSQALKLRNSLYSLKQSPRCCNEKINNNLSQIHSFQWS